MNEIEKVSQDIYGGVRIDELRTQCVRNSKVS